MKRLIFGLMTVFGLAGVASASFDLVLVLDDGNKAIHRYDGGTGIYLGRIDMPNTALRCMAIDQASNRVYVGDNIGFHAFDYNTGQLLFSNFASTLVGSLAFQSGVGLVRGSANGNVAQSMPVPTSSSIWTGSYTGGPGSTYQSGVGITDTGRVVSLSQSGGITRASLSGAEETVNLAAGTYGRMRIRGNQLIAARTSSNGILFGSANNLAGLNVNATTIGVNAVKAVDFGHDNVRYAVGINPNNAAQGMVAQLTAVPSGSPALVTKQFGSAQLLNPVDVAVVVAPEPGTMIALGAGVLALLRRRERR